MKRLFLSLLSLVMVAATINAIEPSDSLSYALGYQVAEGVTTSDENPIHNNADAKEFISGLRAGFANRLNMADSTYLMSYMAGVLQATFRTDALALRPKEDWPPLECMIEGLRRVVNNEVTLPADTTEAIAYARQYVGKQRSDFDAETQCNIYRAMGIVQPYSPQVDEFINQYDLTKHYTPQPRAYAQGMIDTLEPLTMSDNPFIYGKSMSQMLILNGLGDKLNEEMFITGAEAVLKLTEPLIPADEIENMIMRHSQDQVESE